MKTKGFLRENISKGEKQGYLASFRRAGHTATRAEGSLSLSPARRGQLASVTRAIRRAGDRALTLFCVFDAQEPSNSIRASQSFIQIMLAT